MLWIESSQGEIFICDELPEPAGHSVDMTLVSDKLICAEKMLITKSLRKKLQDGIM